MSPMLDYFTMGSQMAYKFRKTLWPFGFINETMENWSSYFA
jgi:hypothetical protein